VSPADFYVYIYLCFNPVKQDNIHLFSGGKIPCQGCKHGINSSPLLDIEAKKGPLSGSHLLMLTDLLTAVGGFLHSLFILFSSFALKNVYSCGLYLTVSANLKAWKLILSVSVWLSCY